MNRREALSAVSALFGGTVIGSQVFLAGCAAPEPEAPPFVGVLEGDDMVLLDEAGETILPATEDSPGAKAAAVGAFMNLIVTDCYSPEEQAIFRAGLLRLNAESLEQYGKTFLGLTPEERHSVLLGLEEESRGYTEIRQAGDPDPHYYTMIKQLTVWGYFTSEVGATMAHRWLPVPGRFEGCTPYVEGEKAWSWA